MAIVEGKGASEAMKFAGASSCLAPIVALALVSLDSITADHQAEHFARCALFSQGIGWANAWIGVVCAAAASALCVQKAGAMPSLPHRDEVVRLIEDQNA